ncbi:Dolichyl-phosphate-mannose-protein mannosyltransferase [Streptomyces sp. BpilaLS-43]|uniref:glycosyltransferase family 39 protein n=1 Tax=Streptomyces sp. BpilaLS-43 TaxID=1839778 RepID=UPI00081B9898|nr:glycosyltransferase family 39 protein [Streptomyces sp. BpilaLS-43]SCD48166.1 Dolichyl-phosphate-mannose-protein mannosyltransferase [Streptomyces sp. BpilaLS-43]
MPDNQTLPRPASGAPPRPAGVRLRARAALAAAAPALAAYAAVRAVGLVVLQVWASAAGKDAWHLLGGRWDSVWYQRIAENGYGYTATLPDGTLHPDLAFFPLLPALERSLAAVTPLTVRDAGIALAWLAGLCAAWGVYAVGARLHGRRAGVVLAALWGAYPTAFVQSMAYTETLFTALAAWALYAVLRDRWVVAGALSVLAGLTRPSAAALIAALAVTAAVALVREYRSGARPGLPRRRARMLLGVCLAPLGWLAYVVFVAVREGGAFAYFEVQAEWGNSIDGGRALAAFIARLPLPAALGLCAALGLLGWLVVLCVRQRQPLPLLVYGIAVVVVSLIGSGYFGSRPRLMMPAFPLLLPPALALLRLRTTARTAGVLTVLALASAGYGAWTLLGPGPP